MELIDVTVVGGHDIAAVVERSEVAGGVLVRIGLRNDSSVPARPGRVAVLLEAPVLRHVAGPGWEVGDGGHDGPPVPGGVAVAPFAVTDGGALGWLGSGRHRGSVAVKGDGWLVTAWAELDQLLLWPGEETTLDPLWFGPGAEGLVRAWCGELGRRPSSPPATEVTVVTPGGALPRRGHVAVAADAADLPRLVARHDGPAGAVLDPWPDDGDLTRPGLTERLTERAAAVVDAGAVWVVVPGAPPRAPAGRWAAASTTPEAALAAGLRAVRTGLGDGPILHLSGGAPTVGAGIADVVDTGPGWPAPDALDGPRARSLLDGAIWHASTGPLRSTVPEAVASALSGCRLHWSDPGPSGAA